MTNLTLVYDTGSIFFTKPFKKQVIWKASLDCITGPDISWLSINKLFKSSRNQGAETPSTEEINNFFEGRLRVYEQYGFYGIILKTNHFYLWKDGKKYSGCGKKNLKNLVIEHSFDAFLYYEKTRNNSRAKGVPSR